MWKALTVIVLVVSCICFGESNAQTDSSSTSIISRSPFIPSGFNPSAQDIASNPSQVSATGYEFRGVYQIGDRYWFLISEPQSRDGNWIELGKNHDDIEARSYDPETKSLTVFSNNAEHKLELAQMESNPKPIPVQGLVKATARTPTITPTPVRRTIRPTESAVPAVANPQTQTQRVSTPPPAWLEKLRAEAAERRAQASLPQENDPDEQDVRRRTITPNRPPQDQPGDHDDRDDRSNPLLRSR